MRFSDIKLKWKIVLMLGLLLVPSMFIGLSYVFTNVKNLQVYTALSGLMNFVDSKQQGVIRFLGQNEKLAKQLAVLVENARPNVVETQFRTIVETDVFNIEDHLFQKEIRDGNRPIATWEVYHAIDFVRDGVVRISSNPARVGLKIETPPDTRHGYSDVYRDGLIPILSFGAQSGDGMVYVHVNAGMLTIITNGEIGNLEGDMGAYFMAGEGETFDYYIVNRDNLMITESRAHPNSMLHRKGSEFPWMMTMGKALEIGIICLPDGTYKTNAGHYTGQREAMGFYTGHNGKEMLGVSMPFYDSEWTIVVEQEADELLAPLYTMTYRLAASSSIILLLILLAGIYLSFNISQPLSRIIKRVVQLRHGDTTTEVGYKGQKDEIGDLANAVEVFRENIIDKNLADETLRKLSHTVEQSAHMVIITDVKGVIEYVNPKFTEWMGYTYEEAIGNTPRIIQSSEMPDEFYVEMWRAILSGNEWYGEIKDRRKNGEVFWAAMTIAPLRDIDNRITHFVANHEDISQRKEAELAMIDARQAADNANKAKTNLLANMSHELRTPLNAIIGFSAAIQEEIFGPIGNDKYQEYLGDIHSSGEHLLELINDILDLSAYEEGALEINETNLDPFKTISSMIRIIKPRAEHGHVNVTASDMPDNLQIYADERRVKQVLLNLLSNAVKFTPEGGKVIVNAALNDDGSLSIFVSDTGNGMNDDEIVIALSKFGQVDSGHDRKHEGTGLGLPLTLGLMELHDGTLEIDSLEGYGTMVTATFPKERVVQNIS